MPLGVVELSIFLLFLVLVIIVCVGFEFLAARCEFLEYSNLSDMEVEEVEKDKATKKSRERKLNKYMEEWMKILPGSSNAISANDHDFKDPYAFICDAIYPDINGYEIFM